MVKNKFIKFVFCLIFVSSAFSFQEITANEVNENVAGSFHKSPKATKLLKSTYIPYGIWFDPGQWKKTKNLSPDAEFTFKHKQKDAYACMVNEDVGVSMDFLTNFVIGNITEISEHCTVIEMEDRQVNGLPVKFIKMDVIFEGVHCRYLAYLYCGDEETVQILAFAPRKNTQELEEIINGFSKVR